MEALRIVIALVIALPTAGLVAVCGYLFAVALAAYAFRPKKRTDAEPLRIAVVVPAHNEAGQIEAILADAHALDYPEGRCRFFFIADNCTDDTARIVREAGFTAVERQDPDLRGKGHALDWFLTRHRAELEEFDAISIVDADMRIDPAYLRELSASLSREDVQVVQASNGVSRPETNWRTAMGFLGFAVINHVRPAGRMALGGTAELRGSGMAFRAGLLLARGWPAHSLAEDVEFSKQLLLDGIRVHYNPDAKVTSELAVRRDQHTVQQQRWEGGRADILRRYLPLLARRAATFRWLYVDALLDLMVPPLSMLVLSLVVTGGLAALVHPAWAAVVGACFLALAFAVVSGPVLLRAPARVWLYLLAAPFFVAWKIPLMARVLLRKGPASWQRTPRAPD